MSALHAIARLLCFLALISLAIACFGQANENPQPQRTIQGVVVNSMTGQPIASALVQGGRHAALTDREGQFELPNITDGKVWIAAAKPGYFPGQPGAIESNLLPQENPPIRLKLIPEAILSGTVLDANGQPLQGLLIQLKMLQVASGLRRWQQVRSTETSVEGEFRFALLQAGKYSLSTGFQMDGLPDAASSVGFVPVIYPSANGDEEAALTLAPGDHLQASLSPPAQKLYAVNGHLDGPPVPGINVEAESSSGATITPDVRWNAATSEFHFRLPSGSYHLKVHSYSAPDLFVGAREISISEAPLNEVSISLAPLATIPVEVEYQSINVPSPETAQPALPNIWLEDADPAGPGKNFSVQPLGPSSSEGRITHPRPGDSLAIRYVEPGHYRLLATPQPPWYLASASCGGLDLMREQLEVAGSAAGCTIHVLLRSDSAELHWSIHSNSEIRHGGIVYVYALPFENSLQSFSAAATQPQAGDFTLAGSFESLAPGQYLMLALDHSQEIPYREAGVLRQYLSVGQEVTLTPNGKSDVQINLLVGEP